MMYIRTTALLLVIGIVLSGTPVHATGSPYGELSRAVSWTPKPKTVSATRAIVSDNTAGLSVTWFSATVIGSLNNYNVARWAVSTSRVQIPGNATVASNRLQSRMKQGSLSSHVLTGQFGRSQQLTIRVPNEDVTSTVAKRYQMTQMPAKDVVGRRTSEPGVRRKAGSGRERQEGFKKAKGNVGPVPRPKADFIDTPYGPAVQSLDSDALLKKDLVKQGTPLYRLGTNGRSQMTGGQFWSLEHPLKTPDFAKRHGIPEQNVEHADFVLVATIATGVPFVTRKAPGIGENGGGAIEVVTPRNGTVGHRVEFIRAVK